jgi:hypothetical protein
MDLREQGEGTARHPWEIARARFFCDLVAGLPLPKGASVLDVGAGDGWLSVQLAEQVPAVGPITCWDINYDDAVLDQDDGPLRVREPPATPFDVVLLLDVLEHVADDETFLRDDVLPRLKADGWLVVSVPAHPSLYTAHDAMLLHERRYRVREIRALLRRSGTVVQEGSLFTTLLPLRAAEKLLESVRHKEPTGIGHWTGGPGLTRLLTGILGADAAANRWLTRTPAWAPGLSYWATVQPADARR